MHARVRVGPRLIGAGEPCFVIAEAGVNHNGDPQLAHALVDAAAGAGADAVKFQTWITEQLVARGAPAADYQRRNVGTTESQFDLLKRLELPFDEFGRLEEHAEEAGLVFLSTPDEETSADFLDELGIAAFKVGSGELTNPHLLAHLARKGRPLIVSTGMATLEEVSAAVAVVREAGDPPLVLLHCVSAYPAEPADANLRAMDTLAVAFGVPIGFSDHTLGVETALAAVARGACVVEKHLTLDTGLPGPDHRSSLDPAAFAAFVHSIRTVEASLGDGVKRPVAAEQDARATVRRALVLARALRAGEMISAGDVALRRASGGLAAAELPRVVGRRVRCDLDAGAVLAAELLE